MTRSDPRPTDTVHVRKYPNRRLYDQTRGGHITHDQLYDLVASGRTVVVTDTATDRDITNVVLAQVLIERDPLKLAAFPPSMLHQLIRTNDQILQSFITRYFNQMMEAFLAMRQQFGSMLPTGAPVMPLTPFDWAMTMMRGAAAAPPPHSTERPPDAPEPGSANPSNENLAELRVRLDQMAAELTSLKSAKKEKPASKRKNAAPKRTSAKRRSR